MTKSNIPNYKIFVIGSLYQWALATFFIVTLPLIFAIIYSVIEVTNYTQKSQLTLFQTVNTTENSRIILDRLISMERSIRQFQILNEPEIFHSYLDHRNKFLTVIESLKSKKPNQVLIGKLISLQQNENLLYQKILEHSKNNQLKLTNTDLNTFDQLTTQARILLSEGEKRVGIEASSLSSIAGRVRQRLVFSALLSIPLALLLGLTFVHFLTRPIKEIGQAIRNLGEIGFEEPISIKGPHDLTEIGLDLEWLRQRLNRLEHEKQQFIRNISHELKTPLATLKEGTDLLAENVVGELNTEQQEIIRLMKLSNITLYDLVENLLEYQKTISTQIDLNLSVFELSPLLERVVTEYELLLRSKNITLKSKLSPVKIKADYDKLKIIISNVFSNALKYSPQNGTLGLTLKTENNVIRLTIEDQGPGIDKKIQAFIFEDFYQGSYPRAWNVKGSGLGLALVKHYLEAHRGSIKLLKPNKKYCGARFYLLLPDNMEPQNASIS